MSCIISFVTAAYFMSHVNVLMCSLPTIFRNLKEHVQLLSKDYIASNSQICGCKFQGNQIKDQKETNDPDPGPVSSLKVTDKHYGGDTDEMVFIKRHRHQRSQMAEAGSENDPATLMPQGSGREPSWLKEMGSLHPSGHTRTVRSTSFSAHGEYLRLEEPIVNNYVRPVRRTSRGEYSDVEGEELKDLSRQIQRTFFNVNREYSRLKEMNGTGTENGHLYSASLHCLTRQELHA